MQSLVIQLTPILSSPLTTCCPPSHCLPIRNIHWSTKWAESLPQPKQQFAHSNWWTIYSTSNKVHTAQHDCSNRLIASTMTCSFPAPLVSPSPSSTCPCTHVWTTHWKTGQPPYPSQKDIRWAQKVLDILSAFLHALPTVPPLDLSSDKVLAHIQSHPIPQSPASPTTNPSVTLNHARYYP